MKEQAMIKAFTPFSHSGMRSRVPVAAALAALLAIGAIFAGGCTSESGTVNDAPPEKDYIARVSVVGEIGSVADDYTSSDDSYHHDWTLKILNELISDKYNKGIVLYVDSPGGSVYESDELYLKLLDYKSKTSRPVYVYMGPMAASGAYYISAAADKIFANRNTWTGSIGVISGTYFDVSGFLKKHGISATDVTSGRNKGMGGYFAPMTDEQKAIIQSLVDEAYLQFTDIVATGRGIDLETVKTIADGRIYTAKQALANGLVDAVMTESEAINAIKTEIGGKDINVSDVRFVPASDLFGFSAADPFSFFGLLSTDRKDGAGALGGAGVPASGADGISQGDISRVLDLATQDERVPLKYLYGG
jgi:protease-4